MSSQGETDDVKKARFFYQAVVKADEISTRSYERTNSKISVFITVLSAVIPLLTGLGYIILSNTLSIPFFIFYVLSLIFFIIALAKCVHLSAPRYFLCVDFGDLIRKYENESLEYVIYKFGHTLEYTVKENIKKILSFRSGLQRIVQFIIVGLIALVFSFILLGINYYLADYFKEKVPAEIVISETDFQLLVLLTCIVAFVVITIVVLKYTSSKTKTIKDKIMEAGNTDHLEKKELHFQGFLLFYAGLLGLLSGLWGNVWASIYFEYDILDKVAFHNVFWGATIILVVILLVFVFGMIHFYKKWKQK